MEGKDTKICDNATQNKSTDISGLSSKSKNTQVSETIKKDLPDSDIIVEKMYISWENDSNSCWLDSSLALLAHNKTMRLAMTKNLDCQVSKAIKSFDKAIATLNDYSSDKSLEDKLVIAKNILKQSQENCLNYLQPLIKYKKGEPDSAFCSLLNLIKENKTIKSYFDVTFSWVRCCDKCEVQQVFAVTKPIITIARVDVFIPESLTSPYQCQQCKTNDQKMKLVYKKVPNCLIYHFENGAGTGSQLPHRFTIASRDYDLTCVMMLEKGQESNVNHFISYIRDSTNSKWLECNDLNPEVVTFVEGKAEFKLVDVYICVFEAFDDLDTVEVESESSLIYADLNIPCIDLADEEDKALPKKESESEKESNDDSETVEKIKKFLTASLDESKDKSPVKEKKNTKLDSSNQVCKDDLIFSNLKVNVLNEAELKTKEGMPANDKPKKEKGNFPVKGFDVEKFVEQKLSELAASHKNAFTLGFKIKAHNVSAIESKKTASQPKNETPIGKRLMNSKFKNKINFNKGNELKKVKPGKKPQKRVKDICSAVPTTDNSDDLTWAQSEADAEGLSVCTNNEIKSKNSTSHPKERCNEMLSYENDELQISISDVKSLNEDNLHSYENTNHRKSDLTVPLKSGLEKDLKQNLAKPKQKSVSLKAIKHVKTSVRVHKRKNDYLIHQISSASDNNQNLSPPNEDKRKSKLGHAEKATKSEASPKKENFKNDPLTLKGKNVASSVNSVPVFKEDNSENFDVVSLSDQSLFTSPLKEIPSESVSESKESLTGKMSKTFNSKMVSKVDQPRLEYNSNSSVATHCHNYRQISRYQTHIIKTTTCKTYAKLPSTAVSKIPVTKNLDSPDTQDHDNSADNQRFKTKQISNSRNKLQKKFLKVKMFPSLCKRKTKPSSSDSEEPDEHLSDIDDLDETIDTKEVYVHRKKPKTNNFDTDDISRPSSSQIDTSADPFTESSPMSNVIAQPSSFLYVPSITNAASSSTSSLNLSTLPNVIAIPSSVNIPAASNFTTDSPNLLRPPNSYNVSVGPSLSVVNHPTMNTSVGFANGNSIKKSPNALCSKPNCHCFKVEREKVVDSTVDYFLMKLFQMYPLKETT